MSDFDLDPSQYGRLSQPRQPGVGDPEVDPLAQEENRASFTDYFKDIALAVPRGLEGAVQDTWKLADTLTGDALPNYDKRVFGESETLVGGFAEGAVNFGAGFIAPYLAIGKFGKFGRIANLTFDAEKAYFAEKTLKGTRAALAIDAARGAAAGAVADFVVFSKQDGNLSDLINEYAPSLANPISDYLASDAEDGELEGRLKNVLDGVFFGSVTDLLLGGIRYIKARDKVLKAGGTPEAAAKAAEKKVSSTQLLDAFHRVNDAGFPGTTEPVIWNGKEVKDWTPQDFKDFGDANGVDNFGPLSELKDVEGAKVPGGTEGTFTFYDLAYLRANPIDTRQWSDRALKDVYVKLAASTTPKPGDELGAFNRFVFSMLSPGTKLVDNETMGVMLRARTKEEVQQLADLIPWEPGATVSKAERAAATKQIAEKIGWQKSADGGLGLRNNVDLTRVAELAKLWTKDPSWFLKKEDETWQTFMERTMTQVRGLGAKTASFGAVWQDPLRATIAAVDRHMAKEYYDKIFPTKVARKEWEASVVAKAKAAGVEVKNFDQLLTDRSGSKVFTEELMSLIMSDRTVSITGANVPSHLKDIKWIDRPKVVRSMSDAYKRALAFNDEMAQQLGMSPFVTQWAIWDRRRGKLEPHYSMFPNLEKIPRMAKDQIELSLRADRKAGLTNGNSRGLGKINKALGAAEDVSSTVRFDLDAQGKAPATGWLDDAAQTVETLPDPRETFMKLKESGPMTHSGLAESLDTVKTGDAGGVTLMLDGNMADDLGLVVSVYSENIDLKDLTPARIRQFASQFVGASDLSNVRIGVFKSGDRASLYFNVILAGDDSATAAAFSKANGQRSYWNGIKSEEVVVNDVSLGTSTINTPHKAVAAAYHLAAGVPPVLDNAAKDLVVNGRVIADAHWLNTERRMMGTIDVESPLSRAEEGVQSILGVRGGAEQFKLGDAVLTERRARLVKEIGIQLYAAGKEGSIKQSLYQTLKNDLNLGDDPSIHYLLDTIDERLLSDVSLEVLDRVAFRDGSANGLYNFNTGVVKMSKSVLDVGRLSRTFIHEIWHHLSSFLPDEDVKAIEEAFMRERSEAIAKDADLGHVLAAMDEGSIPVSAPLGNRDYYRFVNIDEWFAEKGLDKTLSRQEAYGLKPDASIVDKVFAYVRQTVANVSNALRYKFGERNADVIMNRFFYTKDLAPFRRSPLEVRSSFRAFTDGIVAEGLKGGTGGTKKDVKFFRTFLQGILSDDTKLDEIITNMQQRLLDEEAGGVPKEGLNPRDLDPTERIMLGLKGNELNLSGYMMEDGPLQLIRTLEVMFGEDMEVLVPGLNRPESFDAQEGRALIELSVMAGGDVSTDGILLALQKYGANTLADARRTNARVHAFKLGLALSSQHLYDIAAKIADGTADDILKADFSQKMLFHTELLGIVKGLGAEQGRGLGFNRAPIDVLALDKANFKQLLDDAKNRGDIEGMARAIKDAFGSGGRNGVAAVSRLARAPGWNRGLDMLFEYWYGAILSGPKTFSVNALGSLMTSVYLPMERMLGGLLTHNSSEIKMAMGELRNLVMPQSEILHVASEAMKRGESALDPGRSVRDIGKREAAITAKNAGLEGVPLFGAAVDWLGKAVRTPGSILQYTDEVVKQANYRATARSYFTEEAMKLGKKMPTEIQQYVEGKMDELIYKGQAYSANSLFKKGLAEASRLMPQAGAGERALYAREYAHKNFDRGMASLSQIALKNAQEATFQTPLRPGSISATAAYVVNKHPLLRFVAPFVTTPVNILGFAGQRLDVFGAGRMILGKTFPSSAPGLERARSRLLQDIYGPAATPRTKAEAAGRLAAGTTMAVTGIYLASTGAITGRGPADPETREILKQAGWLPYSIRVGNSYISFQKLDPFATILGVFADVYDYSRFDAEGDETATTQLLSGIGISLANNFTNKSYLTGISNFMEAMSDPERFVPALMRRYVGSMVPNALNQSVTSVGGDEYVREVRGMLDAMTARVPGLSTSLSPARNMLGEPVTRIQSAGTDVIGQWADLWVPMAYQEVKSDTISRELAVLKYPFQPPSKTRNGLDLTEFKKPGGQDAYDYWNEQIGTISIGGKTLRARLTELMQSSRYQTMSPVSTDEVLSPRVREIRTILDRYKSAAWLRTLGEYEQLRGAYNHAKTMSIQARLGITPGS